MAGRGLGTLTLDLVVKMGGFVRGMNAAERQTDKSLRAMEQRAKQFGKYLGASLAAAATAAVGLYIKNTIEAEKVQAQLMARLRDTGQAAGRSLQQLNDQAAKLQNSTVFDDESIGEAQAALLTFGQVTGEVFDRTIEAATDLATVMGTDVSDAARILGKALSDPVAGIGALRKAGITLTEDQKYLVKSFQEAGRMADAQGVILDALAQKMGSAAEASRDTLGGALESLKNAFNNLLEGDSGSDGVRGTKEAIEQLTATLNDPAVKHGIDTIIQGVVDLTTYMVRAIGIASDFGQAIRDAFSSSSQMSYEGLLTHQQQLQEDIAAAEQGSASALKQLYFGRGAGEVGKDNISLLESASENAKRMKGELGEVNERLARLRALMNFNPAAAGKAGGTPFALNGTEVIHPNDPDLFGSGKHTGAGRKDHSAEEAERKRLHDLEEAKKAAADFTAQLQDMRDEIAGPLDQALTEHNRKLQELTELATKGKISTEELDKAKAAETTLYEKHVAAIEKELNPLAQVIDAQKRELALMGLTGAALQTASDLYGASAEQIAKYGEAIKANNEQIEAAAKHAQLLDDLKSSAEDAFASFIDGSKSAKDAFGDFVQSIQTMLARLLAQKLVEKLFSGFLNGIFSGGGSSAGGSFGSSGWGGLPNYFGSAKGNVFQHGTLTPFARGGIVHGPTVFPMRNGMGLMGEAGPEAVMPLARDAQGRLGVRGGGGVVQNIYVQGKPDDRTAYQIAQRTGERNARAMSRNR
jgi:lambda family phage tail tape measure protein